MELLIALFIIGLFVWFIKIAVSYNKAIKANQNSILANENLKIAYENSIKQSQVAQSAYENALEKHKELQSANEKKTAADHSLILALYTSCNQLLIHNIESSGMGANVPASFFFELDALKLKFNSGEYTELQYRSAVYQKLTGIYDIK